MRGKENSKGRGIKRISLTDKQKKWFPWMVIALFFFAISFVLLFINPSETAFFPQCIFRKLTGWYCPGCGSGRGMYQLVHGHISAAWHLNPALIVGLLLLFFMFLAKLLSLWYPFWHRLNRFFYSSLFATLLLSSILLWWVLRNIL